MGRPSPDSVVSRFNDAKTARSPNEPDWRMAAAYCLPRHYNAWVTEGMPSYGNSVAATRRVAYDSTAALAVPKYAAILERLATPHGTRWSGITVADKSLAKKVRVQKYFQDLNDLLYRYRYNPMARFQQATAEVYTSMGVYGTGPMYMGQRQPNALSRTPSFLYKACPLRDIYILVNDEGEVDTVFRSFWLNVRQFKQKFPNDPLPPSLATKVPTGSTDMKDNEYVQFFHVVHPRTDHDPQALDATRHPLVGSYVCVNDKVYVGDEQGYRSMPYLTPRTFTESGNPYGYSPAHAALPAMGGASAMKKTNLRQGQKAADPVLLAHDDGVINGNVDQRPGAVNFGGVDKNGKLLIRTLDAGNFQVSKDLLQDERNDINDSFFVTLFKILEESKEMTATEVMERVSKESALLSPTAGRCQSELLAPEHARGIDLLQEMGLVQEDESGPGLIMPPELIEAKGEYEIIYTSPLAKGMYAEEVSGFLRSIEMTLQIVNATQDPSHLDHYNFDVAIPEISNYLAVPQRWLNDDKKKEEIAENRGAQQEQEQLMKNAGPIAGALKTASEMQQGTTKPGA